MPDLDMSPYAAFVWPAWGLSALVIVALIARALVASRKWKRELVRLETIDEIGERPRAARSTAGPQA